jgi:hypothetical protein
MPGNRQDKNRREQIAEIGRTLGTVLAFGLLLSYTLNIFVSSYFKIDLTEVLVFRVEDGWCDTATQGIGFHCFGDFYSTMQFSLASPWTESASAYPPFTLVIVKFIKTLYIASNASNLVLLLYLFTLVLALIFPIIHLYATKRVKSLRSCILMAIGLLTLAPAMMVLDRGNNFGFAIPFIYLCYIYASNGQMRSFMITSALLCLWRPQLGVISLYLVFVGGYGWFFRWLLTTTVGYLISFSFFGVSSLLKNIRLFLDNLTAYQDYISLPSYTPSNWSFSNLIMTTLDILRVFGDLSGLSLVNPSSITEEIIILIPVLFLISTLSVIYWKRSCLHNLTMLTLLCLLAILTPSVSMSYYLALLIPIVVVIFYGVVAANQIGERQWNKEQLFVETFIVDVLGTRKQQLLFSAVLLTCFVSWPFTWGMLGVLESHTTSSIGIGWSFGLIFLVIWFFTTLLKRKDSSKTKTL